MGNFKLAIFVLFITVNANCQKNINLPFLGTKYFNLQGGSCCLQSITIYKDGSCVIKGYQAPEWGDDVVEIYKGKYTSVIWVMDEKGKKEYAYKIEKGFITSLDKFGKPERGCLEENKICRVTLENFKYLK